MFSHFWWIYFIGLLCGQLMGKYDLQLNQWQFWVLAFAGAIITSELEKREKAKWER